MAIATRVQRQQRRPESEYLYFVEFSHYDCMGFSSESMMIKLLLGVLMVFSSATVGKTSELPPESVMSDPWQSLSIGYEEGFLGAFCELEKRGVLSRERLNRLNQEIYEFYSRKTALECQPPNCEIEDFSHEELEYMNQSIAADGCPWLKHPETR